MSIGENRDIGLVGGVRGRWSAWDYDASLNHGSNDFTYRLRDSLNASLGPSSPTRFRTGDFAFDQTLANVDFSRGFDAGAAFHTLAVGAEFRSEHYRTGAGDPASYAVGPYTDRPAGSQAGGGLTPRDEADLDRDVASAYATVSSRFGEKFSSDLSARYEHYRDFGGKVTGKLAARYEFAPAFALRGAVSNNFRAPSLAQIGFESTSTGYNAAGQIVEGRLLSVNNPIARALGATDWNRRRRSTSTSASPASSASTSTCPSTCSRSRSTTASPCPRPSPATRSPISSTPTSTWPGSRARSSSSTPPTPAPAAPSWWPTGAGNWAVAACC